MTDKSKNIKDLLNLGEDSNREFNQVEFSGSRVKSPSRNELADEIAAFANSRGGELWCGITDQGEMQEQDISREQIVALDALLVEVSTDSIKPAARIRTEHKQTVDGKRFLIAEIPEGEAQHDSPGGSYLRVGGSKKKLTSEERLRLAQQRGQSRFLSFDESIVLQTGFATLDESLWKPMLSVKNATQPSSALSKLGLIALDQTGNPAATVAGVLLCTRNPEQWLPNACITAVRYRGEDRTSGQLDAREITGPLNQQIADAIAFIMRNMQIAARKEPGRVDLPQYSDKAVFEALVNAVAHRDYSIKTSRIRLSMFKNRLEIQSPGSLPNSVTVESMAERQATRNEVLTSMLGRLPVGDILGSQDRQFFMDRRGDGVPIIHRETEELCGTAALYEMIDNSEVRLTIPAAVLEPSPAQPTLTVYEAGKPLADVDLLVLFPNKTWKRASTDEHGEAQVNLHSSHLPMTVFAAKKGFAAYLKSGWKPAEGTLALELEALPGGGAVIFPENTGQIPPLKGRLNPILDTHGRTYLYATNIAINQGMSQPVTFVVGENLRLTDANGCELSVRIIHIEGRSTLVEYQQLET